MLRKVNQRIKYYKLQFFIKLIDIVLHLKLEIAVAIPAEMNGK